MFKRFIVWLSQWKLVRRNDIMFRFQELAKLGIKIDVLDIKNKDRQAFWEAFWKLERELTLTREQNKFYDSNKSKNYEINRKSRRNRLG